MIASEHTLYYHPYTSFTNTQITLLKLMALWFDKLVILDSVGASWDAIGADHIARNAVQQLRAAGILDIAISVTMAARHASSPHDYMPRISYTLCEAHKLPTN